MDRHTAEDLVEELIRVLLFLRIKNSEVDPPPMFGTYIKPVDKRFPEGGENNRGQGKG